LNHLWLLLLLVTLRLVLPVVGAEMDDPIADDLTAIDRPSIRPSISSVLDFLYLAPQAYQDRVAQVQADDRDVTSSSSSSSSSSDHDTDTDTDTDDVSLTLLGDAAFAELSLTVARLAPADWHHWPRHDDTPPDPPPV
jgi:hypothetical protein